MKIKNLCILGLMSVTLFSSCDSVLQVDPTSKYSVTTFWKTEEHAYAGLMGCYNALMPWRYLHTIEFEMITSNGIAYNEANGTKEMGKGEHLSTTELVEFLWDNCYAGIGRTNTFLDNVDKVTMDETEKEQMKGEAKFLRAFYYLNLVDKFGGVPLITTEPNAAEQESLPRNTKEEVVTQILKDLDDAIAILPTSYPSAQLGRITKGAAQALKARVLLYNSRWSEAAMVAKQIIDAGTYDLFSDFRHLTSETNKHNCEVIFDIENKYPDYTVTYDQNIWRLNRPAPLKELVDKFLCTDGKTINDSPLYDPKKPYENRDPRLLKSIICIGYPFKGKIITASDVVTTGFGLKKYTSYEDDVAQADISQSEHNFILIRYAEVLLTYAEAENEAVGPDASVYDAINQLRRRPDINMPEVPQGLTQDEMRQVIRRERRVELCGEGLYYSDILRWKTAEEENNGYVHNSEGIEIEKRAFNANRDYLWPIPYNQILLNPNLEQNPNWD